MTRPRRRDLFLLLCLIGLVPAFVTSTLPTTTWLPGVEGFRWAWFDLGGTRVAFALVLLLAGALAWPLRPRWLWLAALPLLLLVLTRAERIGAAPDSLRWVERAGPADDLRLGAEGEAVARLVEPARPLDALLARLPPRLPDAAPLADELAAIDAEAQRAIESTRERALRPLQAQRQNLDTLQRLLGRANPQYSIEFERQRRQLAAQERAIREQKFTAPAPDAERLWALRAGIGLHEHWRADKRARWVEGPYLVASAVLMLAVVAVLGVGHRVTLGFAGLAVLAALAGAADRRVGDGALPALVGLQPVFVGLLALGALRVLMRGWLDNREVWRSTPRPVLRQALAWSLLLWSPFALMLAVHLWVGQAVANAAEQRLYCQAADAAVCVPPDKALVRNSDPARDTLREDLHVAIARQVAAFEARAIAVASRASRGDGAATALRQGVRDAYDAVIRPELFDYPGAPQRAPCGFFQPLGCLANLPLDAANAAYRRPRDRMAQALDERVGEALGVATAVTGASSRRLTAVLRDQAQTVSRQLRWQADAALLALAAMSAFGTAALVFVAARALLLILARLLFAQNKDAFMTITPRERPLAADLPPVQLDVPAGDELQIRLQRDRLLMKPAFDIDGAAPNTLWLPPQPGQSVLARLRHRCYWLKEVEAGDEPRTLTLKSTPGTNFFCWAIPAGAEVAFRWDRFAGMSSSLRLRRTLSFKLGTLVLGRVVVASARGPGVLVQHAYTRASEQRSSVSHARVVGWVVGTPFRVESGKSKKNVYVDHCHVVCAVPGRAVHEAAREGGGGHGLWREFVGLFRL